MILLLIVDQVQNYITSWQHQWYIIILYNYKDYTDKEMSWFKLWCWYHCGSASMSFFARIHAISNVYSRYHNTNYFILTIYSYIVLLYLIICPYKCLPVHVHISPLLFFEVTSSTLEMASTVDGFPVGVIWVAPSHDHVIVATGCPPPMVHFHFKL